MSDTLISIDDFDGDQQPASQQLPDKPLKDWRTKFEAGTLEAPTLMQYFQAASPYFLTIDKITGSDNDLARCNFDAQNAKSAIIDVLEEFIFGDNPSTVLEKIKNEASTKSVCGRVFKMNEPFYSCRDCGMDPTCVLCVNCFKQSAHRHHRYKMGASFGGGCCDCGDKEAWRSDPFCDGHTQDGDKVLQCAFITDSMRERCKTVFEAILKYCVRSLKYELDGSMKNLEEESKEDIFCTILYNDETHTFEQVITTLTRMVGWPHKDAVEFVSMIDREGRAVVKCASFQSCNALKAEVEKQSLRPTVMSKPTILKVSVLHKNTVAQQQFSLQLLSWFQDFLTRHAIFRFIFCENLKQNTEYSLRDILTNDSRLWKTARTSWHHLLISGMLMEYENKKTLAVTFTKQYTDIMQDFVHDDHDHSFSIVSLSVQLFTVPSIAKYLIANETAFYKLMSTFYAEAINNHVKKKIIQFTRNSAHNQFKRTAHILYDIKYILSFKPDEWTDELRRNFLHGLQLLIKILREMQGMDAVVRQTGQHMEYEPEWESAFNLHIKIAPVISLILDWCGTDKQVLVKAYRMTLSAMAESDFILGQTQNEIRELADHSVSCRVYDVGSKPVSIHLPLTRFYAALYLHLEKFNLLYGHEPIHLRGKTEQSIEPKPDQIIEPVLCTMAMVAQVHAGLWRRNGYSLLNQLYFYRNVKCRAEMLDRDVVALQVGASLIKPNDFLIHIVNKFNLVNWLSPSYEQTSHQNPEEDSIRQVINMVDELLELFIVVIGERHVPGVGMVTEEDKVKKEIIQYLCIKPFSHSELARTLPESQNDKNIESIINSVADFKKPSQSDKMGVYELKPEYYAEYNMYFYHYTKEEKSKSEEEQRKRCKEKKELVCCPPPKLPRLTPTFKLLVGVLECDVMLHIMHTVLERALDLKARSFSESHLQKILHLIGYALQEQESAVYPNMMFHERATKKGILAALEELINSPRVEAHRDLILWTVRKYKFVETSDSHQNYMDPDEESMATGSCLKGGNEDAEKAEKEERARLAAERRAKIMEQMKTAQNSFMTSNAALFESTVSAVQEKGESAMEWQASEETTDEKVCLGPNRTISHAEDSVVTCILCSEDEVVRRDTTSIMVYSAFVQKSHVLFPHDLIVYPHTSSCGHVMHAKCWKEYFDNEVMKESRRTNRNRNQGVIPEKKEFLCPLCRCLSNAVLPLIPFQARYLAPADRTVENVLPTAADNVKPMPFDKWLYFMQKYNSALQLITNLPETCMTHNIADRFPDLESIVKEFTDLESFMKLGPPSARKIMSTNLQSHVMEFCNSARRAAPYIIADELTESHLVVFVSCAYTVQSLEMYLRALGKPLKGQLSIRQTSCLTGLIRQCCLLVTTVEDLVAAKLLALLRSQLATILTNSSSCFIEWDLFRMLVTFVFITPCVLYAKTQQCMIPNGTLLEYYLLKVVFLTLITKILVLCDLNEIAGSNDEQSYMDMDETTHDADNTPSNDMDSSSCPETDVLIEFYNNHNFYVLDARDSNTKPPQHNKSPKELKALIMKAISQESRVFLRCACLLFRYLTDIDLPDDLYDSDGDRFEVMCEYLGLSSDIESYLKCDSTNGFMTNLAMHPDVEIFRTKQRDIMNDALVPNVPPVRKLIGLPDDYSDIINTVLTFSCPNNDREETSRNPTMCLICGTTLCSMTYCCQYEIDSTTVGACTHHACECGAGAGLFLRIRECELVIIGYNKGSYVMPPYLDKYGETDQGLRRGNPLKLCHERYQKLNLLWLNHGLHEEIARSAESISNVMPAQWQHL